MKTITITVKNKIASATEEAFIVCGNSDIKASFVFDEEWENSGTKTAVFVCSDGTAYYAEILDGECAVPVLYSTAFVKIGVHSPAVYTSTSATVRCRSCVTDEVSGEAVIGDDRYDCLCKIIDGRFPGGGKAGQVLIKNSDNDYDSSWGDIDLSDRYYDIEVINSLLLGKAIKRELVTEPAAEEIITDNRDFRLSGVNAIRFVCEGADITESSIMLTTADAGDISISFENLISYSGPDPAEASNSETWEFDILYGRCIGRRWV